MAGSPPKNPGFLGSTVLASSLGMGRNGQQPIRYIFDTDLADTIHIRYDTHECFGLIYTVNPANTSVKTK